MNRLEKSNSKVYEKLVSLGLLPKKEKTVTVGDVCNMYLQFCKAKTEATEYKHEQAVKLVLGYFDTETPVKDITTDDALKFRRWVETAPLNSRSKEAKPYSRFCVNRRVSAVKSIFHFAQNRLNLIPNNPFNIIESGPTGNTENKDYVSKEVILDVIEKTGNLKWKLILAFGRFAGCRGASDLSLLTWDKIHWSSQEEIGFVTLEGKTTGNVPLHPVLENLLRDWFDRAPEGVEKVFPEVNKISNINTNIKKSIRRAGYEVWKNPWYSLRTSFCNDVLESGVDLITYQHVCRHSMNTALKYYQKYHNGREKKAVEMLKNSPLWCESGSVGCSFAADGSQKNAGNPLKYSTLNDFQEGVKSGVVKVLNEVLQGVSFNVQDVQKIKEEIINMLENTTLDDIQDPQKNLLAISRKKAKMGDTGLEPVTSAL
ncbi:MAG: site-specific integrase [Thermoguttaceae bacterium]|nr:site-specific integrase [Thermoguttaceae bacterium]